MPLTLSEIHEWKKVGKGRAVIDRVKPTVRISHASTPDKNGNVSYEPPIWIQDGKVYYEGVDDPIKKPPFYFWQEVEKWSEAYRQEMKISLPKDWDKQKKAMQESLEKAKEKKKDGDV